MTLGHSRHDIGGVVNDMSATLGHRGPDGSGLWVSEDGDVALGHRRLAIVDLSVSGHQPMLSCDQRWTISYNGELYNSAELRAELRPNGVDFRGHSDTEVFLEAIARWGFRQALERANGMFALAAWDSHRKELWLAVDRFGEKPLYFGVADGTFSFGSELKAIRAAGRSRPSIDHTALEAFVRSGYVPAPMSIYQGISKLIPGSFVKVSRDAGVSSPVRYWDAIAAASQHRSQPPRGEAAVDELEGLLVDAVRRRSIADVPLGAFLSGGIDSSVVVATMAAIGTDVKTYTIGFEQPEYDESAEAREIASHLSTQHTEYTVGDSEARAVIPLLADMYDEPFADSSQIPTHLVSRLAADSVTVALTGDGGDELFSGYDRYDYAEKLARLERIPLSVRRLGAGLLRGFSHDSWDRLGDRLPLGNRPGHRAHKLAALAAAGTAVERFRWIRAIEPNPDRLLSRHERDPGDVVVGLDRLSSRPIREQAMLTDTVDYLPFDILTKVDRAAMWTSLETRVPLLDPAIFDFAWQLHPNDRVRDGQGKWVLRRLLSRHVPLTLFDRPKRGFGVPVAEWLRGPLGSWADELLSERSLAAHGHFNTPVVRRLWADHRSGRANHAPHLWSVLMFQSWHDRWMV